MKTATLAIVAATVLGIQTGRAETKAPEAVSCPKCETVWVKAPTGGKAQGYTRVGKMVCDDCRTAVENVFAGGKLEHACKTCGDLKACQAEQADLTQPETDEAVACSKCETTWVRKARQMGKVTVYRSVKSMTCSHCDKAAKGRLAGTDTKLSCTHCEGGLTTCQ